MAYIVFLNGTIRDDLTIQRAKV